MNDLPLEHQEHLKAVLGKLNELLPPKYIKGYQEHGGRLWEKDPRWLAREIRFEAIDQFVYIYSLIRWIDFLVERVSELEKQVKDGKRA